ncbi:MAG: hypothetical protein WAS33_30405 [Candidatus Promineifilaceae bacterium]|nr:hypothetical protein [Anaerolineaceae bacterium]
MKEALSKFWAAWKRFGLLVGDFVARVVLTVFYFTIFMPFGLIVTLFSDQLDMKVLTPSWLERKTRDLTVEDARRLW